MQHESDKRIDGLDSDPTRIRGEGLSSNPSDYPSANINNDPILSCDAGNGADARLTHSNSGSNHGPDHLVCRESNRSNNSSTREFIALNDCRNLQDTPFSTKTELTADYQGSHVVLASDEFFGAAANLMKTTTPTSRHLRLPNEEDQVQDGWLVKRHEENAFVTIKLGSTGSIYGIDIDTTGYEQCAPLKATVHGRLKETRGEWTNVLTDVPLAPNSHNFFQIIDNREVYSHVHLNVTPGGGIVKFTCLFLSYNLKARFRCYGKVETGFMPFDKDINLASTAIGAEVIQRPPDIVSGNIPNIIIDRANSSDDGWISPRGNKETGSDYTIIKLGREGIIDRFIVDTKHFLGNAPRSVSIEGCCIIEQSANQNAIGNAHWVNLVDEQVIFDIFPNMFHVIPCEFNGPITHIRFCPIPDGGIQQLIVKGTIFERENTIAAVVQDKPTSSSKKRKRNPRPTSSSKNKANTPKRKSTRLRKQTVKYSPT